MDAEKHATRRLSFGPAAELYDRIRPSYPPEALEWLLGAHPLRVLDLGAGTGILTRVLVALGHEVIAVEPDAGMRDKLLSRSPHVLAEIGSAERIPLPDGSVDAVVAGQAYHWFDQDKAHPEIARVLKVGGVFGPLWNMRDDSVDWVKEMSQIPGMEDARDTRSGIFEEDFEGFGPLFGSAEARQFSHTTRHDEESIVALIQSRSYHLTASPEEQRRMESEMRRIVADLGPEFDLPYTTVVTRAHKL